MEQSPSWKTSRFLASQEIPRILWKTKVFTKARHLFLFRAKSRTVYVFPSHFLKTLPNIWPSFPQTPPRLIMTTQNTINTCGNKMPTRCNRGFYCRSYCLLNMFRASLCPSSGAREYYTVVAACGISCCGFQVAGLMWSWGLCVRFAGCCSILQTGHITLSSTPDQLLEKPQHKIPHAATTV